jgi:predicted short-subunit dehydrogenase-like oxidoreductase (DUF2520 family)
VAVFAILRRMAAKPSIAIVGAGRLGTSLAFALREAGYEVDELISRNRPGSLLKTRRLANQVGARASSIESATLSARVVWLCVPDADIFACANALFSPAGWRRKVALHSSGALTSSELAPLKKKGAAIASVHPLMTFVRKARPSLAGVPFALEGDAAALRIARRIVLDLGGEPFAIARRHKAAYHAWGGFTSPLLIAALTVAEQVATRAGMNRNVARRRMLPIVRQTIANYFQTGPADAFTGPLIRGDVGTVAKHLKVFRKLPEAKQVYVALARAALTTLPTKNKEQLKRILK